MSKGKQQQHKARARTKHWMKRRKGLAQRTSALPPKPPVLLPCAHGRLSSSWLSAVLSITDTARPLLTTASCVCLWCWKALGQIFQAIKSSLFPSSPTCWQELNTLRERLEKLEVEFSRLQSVVQNGAAATLAEKSACQSSLLASPVRTQLGFPGPLSLPSQLLVPPVPPPPPPPPPLPPPPPPLAPLCLKKTGSAKAQAVSLKKDVPMQITLQDLMNVKLKKTQSGTGIDKKRSPFEERKALVTLSDLQSVSLKPKAPQPRIHVTNHLITPSRSVVDFRKHLKRLAIKRSPGGTPLTHKENIETGTGLTPIMTQALRRKFQLAHPKSPSPAQLPTAGSFEEQS